MKREKGQTQGPGPLVKIYMYTYVSLPRVQNRSSREDWGWGLMGKEDARVQLPKLSRVRDSLPGR